VLTIFCHALGIALIGRKGQDSGCSPFASVASKWRGILLKLIQKVSAQLEATKPAPQVVNNP